MKKPKPDNDEMSYDELCLAYVRYTASPEAQDMISWVITQMDEDKLRFVISDEPNPPHVASMWIGDDDHVHLDRETMERIESKGPDRFTKQQFLELINHICEATLQEPITLQCRSHRFAS